jgi:Lon protease-like protein
MINEIEIPKVIPVMTLNETVLFPQAIMPLYIFEPRYRAMLKEVLSEDRIFAVASVDTDQADAEVLEIPYSIAGVGVVRACRQNPDGTSNLILQGLARVEFEEITHEEPFRRARIRQISSETDGSAKTLESIQPTLLALIQTQMRLGAPIPKEVVQFLSNIREPESVLDLAIYTLCPSGRLKQQLLETRGILARFEKFERSMRAQIERLKLDNKLKGGLEDDNLGNN